MSRGKSRLMSQFGKAKRGSQFKNLTKKAIKRLKGAGSGAAAFLVSMVLDAGVMYAVSAITCKVKQKDLKTASGKKTTTFGNCFAHQSANGTFEYFYGLLIGGLVMDAATYTVLAPAVLACVTACSIMIPGAGLAIGTACVPAIQTVAQEVIDQAIKNKIKAKIWSGGPRLYQDFYKFYGGK